MRGQIQMSALMLCARRIHEAREVKDERARAGWRGEIEEMHKQPADEACACFAKYLLEEDADEAVKQIAASVGHSIHPSAREGWRNLFEMLELTSQFAGLTKQQTRRRGLEVVGGKAPAAVVEQFDFGLVFLAGCADLLRYGRSQLKLAMEGALEPV